ncbi:hypothetical protein NQ317_014010 [Molorchus minor]|uniref:Uncharacterized protein n=1 Tax=Molorchus minor TaxID=1323400 RepID=A0ABQ9IQP6_9CUCU|nr:hypothetical protein NQ317_014010 [Molorchus minor]
MDSHHKSMWVIVKPMTMNCYIPLLHSVPKWEHLFVTRWLQMQNSDSSKLSSPAVPHVADISLSLVQRIPNRHITDL